VAYDQAIPAQPDLTNLVLVGTGFRADVFAWGPGRVVKLARDPGYGPVIERERKALEAANLCGAPAPRLHERVEVEGRPGLVLDRLGDRDLLVTLTKQPWRVLMVARTMGSLHASLHATDAPRSLSPLRDELRARLGSALVPEDVRATALRRLEDLPDGDALCHGDFHPANILPGGRGHTVIDWTNAVRGDPSADVARTRLILLQAPLPAEAPAPVRRLMAAGREVLLWRYLREYSRHRRLDRAGMERWEPVLAAARLAEDIPEEREALLALARS
jgi:aminoglycoside phosphotransferase (APT) family kinase protein